MTRPMTQALERLESLAAKYVEQLEDRNRLVDRLTSELTAARGRIAELEETNAFLEAKHKEIVERMEAGLEEWARRESARRKLVLHKDTEPAARPRSRPRLR